MTTDKRSNGKCVHEIRLEANITTNFIANVNVFLVFVETVRAQCFTATISTNFVHGLYFVSELSFKVLQNATMCLQISFPIHVGPKVEYLRNSDLRGNLIHRTNDNEHFHLIS